jgi:hypothetical protein
MIQLQINFQNEIVNYLIILAALYVHYSFASTFFLGLLGVSFFTFVA